MLDYDLFQKHQHLQRTVVNWCSASMLIPDLEPERRARIEHIRSQATDRICSTWPHDLAQIGEQARLARQELAWLEADPRLDVSAYL